MIGTDIDLAARLLKAGQLVAIPTETVYGLAGNAFDTTAVLRIFEVKNRPHFNPLIVHTWSMEKITTIAADFPSVLQDIASKYWPGPLTVLLPKAETIDDLITAGSNYVAVRIPDNSMSLELLSKLDFPLCAPSANPFGYISPTTALHVEAQLGDRIGYILDGGPCRVGVESTIIRLNENDEIEILRNGAIGSQDIEKITGRAPVMNTISQDPLAPGMLKNHYAPSIKLLLAQNNAELLDLIEKFKDSRIAVLSFDTVLTHDAIVDQIVLSETGDCDIAARHLFSAMHKLDAGNADIILAVRVPDKGIGRAINDRLMRASLKEV